MRPQRTTMITVLVCTIFLMGMVSAQAQEKKIDIKELPRTVTAVFQKSYPHAKIIGAAIEREKGKAMFEVESKDGAVNRDLLFTDNGEIFEIEESLSPESLPEDITSALEKRFTKYKLVKGEKVTHGTKMVYELTVKSHIKTYAIVLDSSAKIIKSHIVSAK